MNNIQTILISKNLYSKHQAIGIVTNIYNLSVSKIEESSDYFRLWQYDSFLHDKYNIIQSSEPGVQLIIPRKY